jgi:hypothetical protein
VWVVTLSANVVVGSPYSPASYAAVGALPSPFPSLAPLVIPGRDPFAADVPPVVVARAAVAGSAHYAGSPNVGGMTVPDTTGFGEGSTANGTVAVLGVIVGDGDQSRAIVESGTEVDVVRVGDAVAGTRVASISVAGVRLADGRTLFVDAPRRQQPGGAVSSAPDGVLGPDGRPRYAQGVPAGLGTTTARPYGYDAPSSAANAVPTNAPVVAPLGVSGVGQPFLTQPNGNPVVAPSNPPVLFPNAFPTMVPGGGTNP